MATKKNGKMIALRDIFVDGKPFEQGEEVKDVDADELRRAVGARRVADEKAEEAQAAIAEAKAKAEASRKAEVKDEGKSSTDEQGKA